MRSFIPTASLSFTRAPPWPPRLRISSTFPDSRADAWRPGQRDPPFPVAGLRQYWPPKSREAGMIRIWMTLLLLAGLSITAPAQEVQTRDHTVTVTSSVPVIAGKKSKLYVRERALPQVMGKGAGDKVVLFVH